MSDNVKDVINMILKSFESDDIPKNIAYSMFPIPDIPSSKWSMLNRFTMVLGNTIDARGYKQWKEVNRQVKKGSKAIYILVPRIIRSKTEEDKRILAGFLAKPVFRVEDTEGEDLEYQKIELPDFPLRERAEEWGISVKSIPGNYSCYGYFSKKKAEICLATREESVFFHELSHAAHSRLIPNFKEVPLWKKEVIAELSAATLCQVVGKTSKFLGNHYNYIEKYAEKEKLSPIKACLCVISDVEKVLKLLLGE
uniref:N-terminal domain-containing protein n=1 Tax=viral metagenome TaxID=1070528 RepID=A0A6H1ZQ51_9ZZZZ